MSTRKKKSKNEEAKQAELSETDKDLVVEFNRTVNRLADQCEEFIRKELDSQPLPLAFVLRHRVVAMLFARQIPR